MARVLKLKINVLQNSYILPAICTKRLVFSASIEEKLWASFKKALSKFLPVSKGEEYIEFKGHWPKMEKEQFLQHMRIYENFISEEEEVKLFEEVEPYMKRLRYEFDHWDDAIHGYRETERKHWYPHNRKILEKIRKIAFNNEIMPYTHILDLAVEGIIKPHVDSTRYCGDTIAGLSLLSGSVMRMIRTDEHKYLQNTTNENIVAEPYRNQSKDSSEKKFYANILLPRRSLYIMSNSARYNFTHEIVGNTESKFRGQTIEKGRRISIICRNEP